MIKIYGLKHTLEPIRERLSQTLHGCLVDALGMPKDKRAHRFFPMAREDYFFPPDRSDRYVVLEIALMAGRTTETKKRLVRLIFERFESELAIAPRDVEITLFEAPPENWGFRGLHGDEAKLGYSVKV